MNPELAIREHLASYIDGSIDLESFARVPQLWGILGTPRRETAANEGMACCQNGFCLGTRFS